MDLTFVTYNILHGYHKDKIEANVKSFVEMGTDVICLQEAEIPIEHLLPDGWQVEYFQTAEPGCALATAWNGAKLTMLDVKKILLPGITHPALIQKFTAYGKQNIQRGGLSIRFSMGQEVIKITNTHLAWEGGSPNRLNQLQQLMKEVADGGSDSEILAGDFNTLSLPVSRKSQQSKIQNILSTDWVNVFPDIEWTCDVSHTAPQDGLEKFAKLGKLLNMKFRCRLDYVFSRNLKTGLKQMLDWPGSDHRPLMATFSNML